MRVNSARLVTVNPDLQEPDLVWLKLLEYSENVHSNFPGLIGGLISGISGIFGPISAQSSTTVPPNFSNLDDGQCTYNCQDWPYAQCEV